MVILNPDYPHIVWSFMYRGWRLQIDCTEEAGQTAYAVWANHETGCAIAVPWAATQEDAIRRGKRYVDRRLSEEPRP